ncbi:MAG: EamA family transporter [Clostridia bacterium]|nr:EamA family transporter [Clostridia bacterium]
MTLSSLYIIIAGILWGIMGLFVRHLGEAYALTAIQISAVRLFSAGILFILFTLIKDKSLLKIKLRDLPLLFATGLFSVLLMSATYFESINLSSLAVAAILLYTAPIIVMVASLFLFKEKFTAKKALALVLAFSGCVLVSGIASGDAHVTPMGIFMGALSAITYALYSILGKYALQKHHPLTLTAYAFTIAGLGSFIFAPPTTFVSAFQNAESIPALIFELFATGLVTAFLPFLFYTLGLKKTEAGKAAVMASVEPMVASIVGIFILREPTDFLSVTGILLILGAVIILNIGKEK